MSLNRAQEMAAWNVSRRCCAACRRDFDLLRRNPERISEFIDVLGEVLHGQDPRAPRVVEHRTGRNVPREQKYLSCFMWGAS